MASSCAALSRSDTLSGNNKTGLTIPTTHGSMGAGVSDRLIGRRTPRRRSARRKASISRPASGRFAWRAVADTLRQRKHHMATIAIAPQNHTPKAKFGSDWEAAGDPACAERGEFTRENASVNGWFISLATPKRAMVAGATPKDIR